MLSPCLGRDDVQRALHDALEESRWVTVVGPPGSGKTLLVRTYAGALSQVTDQSIVVKPLRAAAEDKDVLVRTEIRGRGDPIQLDYRLEKTPGEGAGWKIYNLNVLGVWLVETYRSQFAQEINAKGVDGLIEALVARNKANAASSAK